MISPYMRAYVYRAFLRRIADQQREEERRQLAIEEHFGAEEIHWRPARRSPVCKQGRSAVQFVREGCPEEAVATVRRVEDPTLRSSCVSAHTLRHYSRRAPRQKLRNVNFATRIRVLRSPTTGT